MFEKDRREGRGGEQGKDKIPAIEILLLQSTLSKVEHL